MPILRKRVQPAFDNPQFAGIQLDEYVIDEDLNRNLEVLRVNLGDGEELGCWLKAVAESGISAMQNFAVGIEKDKAAVLAALTLEWSNGQVEGQVNRLKLRKRQLFGRANFDLLRQYVLNAP